MTFNGANTLLSTSGDFDISCGEKKRYLSTLKSVVDLIVKCVASFESLKNRQR